MKTSSEFPTSPVPSLNCIFLEPPTPLKTKYCSSIMSSPLVIHFVVVLTPIKHYWELVDLIHFFFYYKWTSHYFSNLVYPYLFILSLISYLLSLICFTDLTQCQVEASKTGLAHGLSLQPIGQFVPSCDENGKYESVQCWASIGYCWCVDDNGAEVEGTRMRGRPDCSTKPTGGSNWEKTH